MNISSSERTFPLVLDLPNLRTVAVGDIHGRADLLSSLLDAVRSVCSGAPYRIVFLGDLIDRGPESEAVLERVTEELEANSNSSLVLGNHEEYLQKFIERPSDPVRFRTWMDNGGIATLRSMGFRDISNREDVARRLRADDRIAQVLRDGYDLLTMGDLVFVHAGIRPGIKLEEQSVFDLRWIRDPFLHSRGEAGRTVVHGHTPTRSGWPEIRPGRVNLDTGAFATGRLCAAVFEGDGTLTAFLNASEDGGVVSARTLTTDDVALGF